MGAECRTGIFTNAMLLPDSSYRIAQAFGRA